MGIDIGPIVIYGRYTMKLKVLGPNVLVQAIKTEDSGIISSEEENIIKGTILNVGAGGFSLTATEMKFNGDNLKPKDIIWFNKFDATHLPFDETLYVINKENIIVVEEK